MIESFHPSVERRRLLMCGERGWDCEWNAALRRGCVEEEVGILEGVQEEWIETLENNEDVTIVCRFWSCIPIVVFVCVKCYIFFLQ